MRLPGHEAGLFKPVDDRGHVPRAQTQPGAEVTHDRRAGALQRLEQAQPLVVEPVTGTTGTPTG